MEYDGVCVDTEYLNTLSAELSTKIQDLETKIFEIAGTEFNIASPKQIGEILFDTLKSCF
jgi:DNA polymerase-1